MGEQIVARLPVQSSWPSDENQSSIFGEPHLRIVTRPRPWRPATDVYETESAIVVRVEVAGMREADFSLSLVDRTLLIKGIRQDSNERRAYHQMEIQFGEFSSEIELTVPVDVDQAEAVYRDGFLIIVLPKSIPKQIKVRG